MKDFILLTLICFISSFSYSQCVTTANFSANPQEGCSTPHTVFFTDQSYRPDTWKWEFGDGSISTAQNPIHTYINSGIYTVTLTVTDTIYGCSFTHTEIISIIIPMAGFVVDKSFGCGPLTVQFTDQSTDAVQWNWDFGDGSSSDEQNPSHVYESPGLYTAELEITASNGCKDTYTSTTNIQVIGPEPDFSVNKTEGCQGTVFNFSNNSTSNSPIVSYAWNFGDGSSLTSQNPSHTYDVSGNFSVNLTVGDLDGCSRTISKDELILVHPTYETNETITICEGESTTFPDGTTQNNITNQVIYVSSLTSKDGCDSIINTTVNVNPVFTLNKTFTICEGQSFTFADGTTESNITTQITHTSSLTSKNGCDSIINTTVNVNPGFTLNKTFTICEGQSFTFSDGTTESNIATQTTHTSSLTSKDGCDSIINTTVNVNPVYELDHTDSVCFGGSYTFPDGTTEDNIEIETFHTSTLQSASGCDSIIHTTIKVIEIDPSLILNGAQVTAAMQDAEYKWLDCNSSYAAIPLEISMNFIASVSGEYAVEIEYKNCVDTTECVSIIGTGIMENQSQDFVSLYPNPSNGHISIEWNHVPNISSVNVFDVTGQKVPVDIKYLNTSVEINLNSPSGYYFIEIISKDNKRVRMKLLKN